MHNRNSALVDQITTEIEGFEAQQELVAEQMEAIDVLQTSLKKNLAPVRDRLGNGYECVLKGDTVKQDRKLLRRRDKHLLDKIKGTCTTPALQTMPPDDPTDELFEVVQIDQGKLVGMLEGNAAKDSAELEKARVAGLSEILGRTYNPVQLEDSGALSRQRSTPSGDALSQTSSARRRAETVGPAVSEGTPPKGGGGGGGGGGWFSRR